MESDVILDVTPSVWQRGNSWDRGSSKVADQELCLIEHTAKEPKPLTITYIADPVPSWSTYVVETRPLVA